MSVLTSAVDAVASDLVAQASTLGLPSFHLQKYARPLVENVEMGQPVLSVFPFGDEPMPLATDGSYTWEPSLVIGWFEPVPESLETGFVDETKAKAALDHAEAIIGRAQTYFAGVPGLAGQSEATIFKVRYGKVRGGVFGCEISMRVTTWS